MTEASSNPDDAEWWNLAIAIRVTYFYVVVIMMAFPGLAMSVLWVENVPVIEAI